MKLFSTIVALAVGVTSPVSVCYAQSSYDDCMNVCYEEYEQEAAQCAQYGASLDGEYCYMAASQALDACQRGCGSGGTALAALDARTDHRFRPVHLKAAAAMKSGLPG